ncbi:MAG: AAA family ATPase [Desulfuromonadaceae bacterium]
MKITKIIITNFRGIESLALEFLHPTGKPLDTIVLAGPNGFGKTSVLEACLLAMDRKELLGQRSDNKNNIRNGSMDFSIKLQVELAGERLELARNSSAHENGIAKNLRTTLSELKVEYFSSWREPKIVGAVSVSVGKKGKRPKPTEENRLWLIKQHLVDLTARKSFQPLDAQVASGLNEEEKIFSRINSAWKLFYPGRNDEFVNRALEEGFDVFRHDKNTGRSTSVDQLSSGEIEIFTMLGWFATKELSSGIVFIDEPELHLHPAWHRTIMRALRTILPDTQIICATHSPEVLDSVSSYERFTLLPEDDPRIRMTTEGDAP